MELIATTPSSSRTNGKAHAHPLVESFRNNPLLYLNADPQIKHVVKAVVEDARSLEQVRKGIIDLMKTVREIDATGEKAKVVFVSAPITTVLNPNGSVEFNMKINEDVHNELTDLASQRFQKQYPGAAVFTLSSSSTILSRVQFGKYEQKEREEHWEMLLKNGPTDLVLSGEWRRSKDVTTAKKIAETEGITIHDKSSDHEYLRIMRRIMLSGISE